MTNSVEAYDVQKEIWKPLANMNVGVVLAAICDFNNQYIFKFGGIIENIQLSNAIEKYDWQKNNWEIIDARFETDDRNLIGR